MPGERGTGERRCASLWSWLAVVGAVVPFYMLVYWILGEAGRMNELAAAGDQEGAMAVAGRYVYWLAFALVFGALAPGLVIVRAGIAIGSWKEWPSAVPPPLASALLRTGLNGRRVGGMLTFGGYGFATVGVLAAVTVVIRYWWVVNHGS